MNNVNDYLTSLTEDELRDLYNMYSSDNISDSGKWINSLFCLLFGPFMEIEKKKKELLNSIVSIRYREKINGFIDKNK